MIAHQVLLIKCCSSSDLLNDLHDPEISRQIQLAGLDSAERALLIAPGRVVPV
jgi:hypothetical protein